MKPLEETLLVSLLAEIEALFEPCSPFTFPAGDQGRWQRRDKYLGRYDWTSPGLIPWHNPGEDPTGKKRHSRAMTALTDQGMIRMDGKQAGLTPQGFTAARTLAGHVQLDDCLPGVDLMLSMLGGKHEWTDPPNVVGYVSECSLAGFAPMPPAKIGQTRLPDSALWVIDAILPLAVAGYIGHDFQPHFELPLYHLTDTGHALAMERKRNRKASSRSWSKLEKVINAYADHAYSAAYTAAAAALENCRPLEASRINHHLPSSIWPGSRKGGARTATMFP